MPRFSKARFAKAIAAGMFTINGGEVAKFWIGQDGNFWVETYFRSTYQYLANPVAIHDERY